MNPRNFSREPKCCNANSGTKIATREVGRPNLGQANATAYRKSCSVREQTSSSANPIDPNNFVFSAWHKHKPLIPGKFR